MKSTFLPTGLGYLYTIGDTEDDALITIEVNNLRLRNGSTFGLLSTSTSIIDAKTIPDSDRVLTSECWLLNDRSRADYAKALSLRIPTPPGAARIDFEAILEEVAQRVLEWENAPVQIVDLADSPLVPHGGPTVDLVEGLVPAHQPTILYGPGGIGKSIFAAALAVAIQNGQRFLGLRTRKAKVLYLDWETDEDDIALRVRAAAAGMELTEALAPDYASLVRPIEDQMAQLARSVAEKQYDLVIIDSVGMAMTTARDGADPSEGAIRFFRALRALDTAVLALDHVAGEDMRRGRSGAPKPYGSVYKWNSARNAFELREREDPDSEGSHLLLKHRKSNIGPKIEDIALLLRWDGARATFSRERYKTEQQQTLVYRLMEVLRTGPATARQLGDLLSTPDDQVYEMDVRRALKGMMNERLVVTMADGTIRVVPPEPDTVE